jgi:hypothetical protein
MRGQILGVLGLVLALGVLGGVSQASISVSVDGIAIVNFTNAEELPVGPDITDSGPDTANLSAYVGTGPLTVEITDLGIPQSITQSVQMGGTDVSFGFTDGSDWDVSVTSGGIATFSDSVAPPVPEPTTFAIWSLLGSLAVGLGWWQKRKAA